MNIAANNSSLVKNAAFLYVKVALSMVISFFSSRILLDTFGAEDFGLFNLIAGAVSLLYSLRVLFAGAIQRFINVSKGENNLSKMNAIFNTGVIIHFVIAGLFLVLAETIGLWYLNNNLVIDPERLHAANVLYHIIVVTGLIYILIVPYEAIIIAHERMKFYAINTTSELFVKLLIILGLPFINYDYLIAYGFLLLLNTLIFRIIMYGYCRKNFSIYEYNFNWNRELIKELSGFSGWNFLGNTAYLLSHEGINIVLNLFGGTILNASRAISAQVLYALNQFVANIVLAVRPRAVTLFANNRSKAYSLLYFSTKSAFFILLAIVFPITLFLGFYFKVWLKEVPEYAEVFSSLLIIYLLIRIFHDPVNVIFHANGVIKKYQIFESIALFMVVPISYLCLYFDLPYYSVFIVLIVIEVITIVIDLQFLKTLVSLNLNEYFHAQLKQPLIVIIMVTPFYVLAKTIFKSFPENFLSVIAVSILSFVLIIWISYFIGFNTKEKDEIKLILVKLKNRFL